MIFLSKLIQVHSQKPASFLQLVLFANMYCLDIMIFRFKSPIWRFQYNVFACLIKTMSKGCSLIVQNTRFVGDTA